MQLAAPGDGVEVASVDFAFEAVERSGVSGGRRLLRLGLV